MNVPRRADVLAGAELVLLVVLTRQLALTDETSFASVPAAVSWFLHFMVAAILAAGVLRHLRPERKAER